MPCVPTSSYEPHRPARPRRRHLSTLWLPPPVSSLAIGSGALPFQFNLYHVTSGPSSWDKYRDPFKFPNIMVSQLSHCRLTRPAKPSRPS